MADSMPPTPPPPPPPAYGGGALPPNPTANYAGWGARVGAYLIDYIPIFILTGIGYAILIGSMASNSTCVDTPSGGTSCVSTGSSGGATLFAALFFILSFVYWLWNRVFKMGTTGSSLGMGVAKTKAIGERTGQPIGAGMNFLRQILLMVDFWICYIGVLWPLWDQKKQCLLSDKVASTIVVKV